MADSQIQLPKDKQSLAKAVNGHFDRELLNAAPKFTTMRIAQAYLMGVRKFQYIDFRSGKVVGSIDLDGKTLPFAGSDLLKAVDQVTGHLSAYDMTPVVERVGSSLNSIRETANAQVLLDAMVSPEDIKNVQKTFSWMMAALGCAGLHGFVDNQEIGSLGLTASIQAVHPFELVPFPSFAHDISKLGGLGRQSFVPIEVLVERFGRRRVNSFFKDRPYWLEIIAGEDPTGSIIGEGFKQPSPDDALGTTPQGYMRIRELWVDGPRGTCRRKVTISGDAVIEDLDFTGLEVYRPLYVGRFIENGTFYGAGMYDLLYPIARQLEFMNDALFKDVTNKNKYGFLVLPQGNLSVNKAMQEYHDGLKVMLLEPDNYSDNGMRPLHVQPPTNGDAANRTVVYAKTYLDSLSPLTDIIREKGRIDSQTGLAFLQEQVNRAMTNPTAGMASAFSCMYKSLLQQGVGRVMQGGARIPLTKINLALAGASIDWAAETVEFNGAPINNMSLLNPKPKLTGAKSPTQRKMEALELTKLGVATPQQFLLKAIEEGWDLPIWMAGDSAEYESSVRDALILYGDGETPGNVEVNPNFIRPALRLMIWDSFMASSKMMAASVEVKNAFIQTREMYQEMTSQNLPPDMPNSLDEEASLGASNAG